MAHGVSASDIAADVVVVGAGPVGLCAALACRSLGLSTIVVEAESADRVRPGSRALFLHHEPLAELARFEPGIDREIIDAGMLWSRRRYYFAGSEFYCRSFADNGKKRRAAESVPAPSTSALAARDAQAAIAKKAHGSSLSQVETERILMRAVRARGVEIRWNTEITGIAATDDAVTVNVAGGAALRARYAIGCDGARSAVRKSLGIAMTGDNLDSRWVIIDIDEVDRDPMPPELVFHYEHPRLDGLNVLLLPFKGGWRIDVQCKTQADLERMSTPEGVREWLPKVVDARYVDRVRWISTYRFNKLAAASFTDETRRVLLAGEAAHLFPPFGGRGLNSGIVDAVSAARGIAQALVAPNAAAARAIIDDVALDRRDAARFNMEAAASGVRIMAPTSPWLKLKRRLAVAATPWSARARYWLSLGPNGRVGGRPGKAGIY